MYEDIKNSVPIDKIQKAQETKSQGLLNILSKYFNPCSLSW